MNHDELTRYFAERDEWHRSRLASRATWSSGILVIAAICMPSIATFLLIPWILVSSLALSFHTERWSRMPLWLVVGTIVITMSLTYLVFIPDVMPSQSIETATNEGPQ